MLCNYRIHHRVVIGQLDNRCRVIENINNVRRCLADHVHILCGMSRTHSLAKIVEEVKKGSSKWLKTKGPELAGFYWQAGYGAFSVSPSNIEEVRTYILQQEQHHRKMTFQEEYRQFLERHGVEFDERYVWD